MLMLSPLLIKICKSKSNDTAQSYKNNEVRDGTEEVCISDGLLLT